MADSRGRVWTGVLRVEPHRGDHRVALRAAVSVAVPLLVLWALGRLDLSIYASFGAFAALYGRHDVFRDRIRMQAVVTDVTEVAGGYQIAVAQTTEVEGGTKPAVVSTALYRFYA